MCTKHNTWCAVVNDLNVINHAASKHNRERQTIDSVITAKYDEKATLNTKEGIL